MLCAQCGNVYVLRRGKIVLGWEVMLERTKGEGKTEGRGEKKRRTGCEEWKEKKRGERAKGP